MNPLAAALPVLLHLQNAAEAAAWIDAETATLIGAYGGAGIGVVGGIVGTLAGILAPRGKGRRLVVGSMTTLAILGGLALIFGLIALAAGQPFPVYYPFLLIGLVLSSVCGPLIPVVRKRYREAERRRMDADALRRS